MGKTRDLFKKIRDTKGTFQAKEGTIKDRNGKDLTEVESMPPPLPGGIFTTETPGKPLKYLRQTLIL